MNFTALELHIDKGGPTAESLQSVYKEMMYYKPLIIWGEIPEYDLDWIFNHLPARGLAIITVVKNAEEAKCIWNKYIT